MYDKKTFLGKHTADIVSAYMRFGFYEVNLGTFNIMDWKYSYTLDLSCPNRQTLEVSKNVKFIAVTTRASKLQVFKVGELRDLNQGLPRESIPFVKWLTREVLVQFTDFPKFGDL